MTHPTEQQFKDIIVADPIIQAAVQLNLAMQAVVATVTEHIKPKELEALLFAKLKIYPDPKKDSELRERYSDRVLPDYKGALEPVQNCLELHSVCGKGEIDFYHTALWGAKQLMGYETKPGCCPILIAESRQSKADNAIIDRLHELFPDFYPERNMLFVSYGMYKKYIDLQMTVLTRTVPRWTPTEDEWAILSCRATGIVPQLQTVEEYLSTN